MTIHIFCPFFIGLSFCYWVVRFLYQFWIEVLFYYMCFKIFLLVCCLLFTFLKVVFCIAIFKNNFIFFSPLCFSCVCSVKETTYMKVTKIFCLLLDSFMFYIIHLDLSVHLFPYRYPVELVPLVEKIFLSPLNCLTIFVKLVDNVHVWVYRWTYYSVLLIHISNISTIPNWINIIYGNLVIM